MVVDGQKERARAAETLRRLADEVERGEWAEVLIKPDPLTAEVYLYRGRALMMDDETTLRETTKTINNTASGHNPTGRWPDLRSEPFRGDRVSVGGPLPPQSSGFTFPREGQTHIIVVDKTIHRVRFESETESEVRVVIEPK